MAIWNIRYYVDPGTGLPHIYSHGITEPEIVDVLLAPGEDRQGYDGARVAIGRTEEGKYLRIIYVADPEPGSVFVITAYQLQGKALAAYRRRSQKRER